VDNYATADDLGNTTLKQEPGLGEGQPCTCYVWAYNSCGVSAPTQLTATAAADPCIGLGLPYQGGKIVYIDGTGKHGLIAAPQDISGTFPWFYDQYPPLFLLDTTYTAIGYGNRNTNIIIAQVGNVGSYAAKLCADLAVNGYDDWFLPSKDELNQIYINRSYLDGIVEWEEYWSSSVTDAYIDPWYQNLTNGSQMEANPFSMKNVRPMRQF